MRLVEAAVPLARGYPVDRGRSGRRPFVFVRCCASGLVVRGLLRHVPCSCLLATSGSGRALEGRGSLQLHREPRRTETGAPALRPAPCLSAASPLPGEKNKFNKKPWKKRNPSSLLLLTLKNSSRNSTPPARAPRHTGNACAAQGHAQGAGIQARAHFAFPLFPGRTRPCTQPQAGRVSENRTLAPSWAS